MFTCAIGYESVSIRKKIKTQQNIETLFINSMRFFLYKIQNM